MSRLAKKLSHEQLDLRLEVRNLAKRACSESCVSMVTLADVLGCSRMHIWNLLKSDACDKRTITLSDVLAWLKHPASQEFARILLSEMLSQFDVQQLRLIDLYRYADNPRKSEVAATVIASLAERIGLIPANQTTTAGVVAK